MKNSYFYFIKKHSRQEQWKEFLASSYTFRIYSDLFFGEINDDGYKQQL